MPQSKLLNLLKQLPNPVGCETPDVSVVRKYGANLISTMDFFYPLVECPYMFGRIAFCNTVSDLYAMGAVDISEVLMILGVSTAMDSGQQDTVTKLMIEGFSDAAVQAKTAVGGGQTVYNPWPMMGGAAVSLLKDNEFRIPNRAEAGNVLVLTKPLGMRFAINAMQWLKVSPEKKAKITAEVSESELIDIYFKAEREMATLNVLAATLLHEFDSKAATDVTGFGILGHADYLAQAQRADVDFVIEKLPTFKNLAKIEGKVQNFRFFEGYAAETSGGLLVCLAKEKVDGFRRKMAEHGENCWVVGHVTEGSKRAVLAPKVELVDV